LISAEINEHPKAELKLLRCAIALENLSPKALDTEISEFVVDEAIESPQQRDESEGLDEIRRSY
jgi:hypothetical protein